MTSKTRTMKMMRISMRMMTQKMRKRVESHAHNRTNQSARTSKCELHHNQLETIPDSDSYGVMNRNEYRVTERDPQLLNLMHSGRLH